VRTPGAGGLAIFGLIFLRRFMGAATLDTCATYFPALKYASGL